MMVAAPPSKAWDVLTSYEKTALKMPDIKKVKIISSKGELLKVEQTYKAPYTFGLKVKALLEIEEKPKSMLNYKLLQGSFIHNLEGNWILIPLNGGTLIAHRIEIEPAVPGFLKPLFNDRFEKNLKNTMIILRQLILEHSSEPLLEAVE